MTDLAIRTGGPGFSGRRILRIAGAVVACHRWAYAMQHRYDRLGAGGFRRDGVPVAALLQGLDANDTASG